MKQIYILHAQHATNPNDWCQWMVDQAAMENIQAKCIALPKPEQPDFVEWQSLLQRDLAVLNPQSVVIADDTACLALLHYLSQSKQKLQALLLIAPFIAPLPHRPELNAFVQQAQFNFEQLRLQVSNRVLFFSSNDPLVPPPFSLKLVSLLNMQPIEVKNAGHFSHLQDSSAYVPLWEAVSKLFNMAYSD